MSAWRNAPAGVAVAVAVGAAVAACGFALARERAHGAEMQALTKEIAAMRADLASVRQAPAEPPAIIARCAIDAEQVQAIAATLGATLGRAPDGGSGSGRAVQGPAEPQERTTEQEVALAGAGDLIEATIRRGGTLTRDDMSKIHEQLAAAGRSAESDALSAKLSQAINLGKLVPERPH
jgi:hypothetical protein